MSRVGEAIGAGTSWLVLQVKRLIDCFSLPTVSVHHLTDSPSIAELFRMLSLSQHLLTTMEGTVCTFATRKTPSLIHWILFPSRIRLSVRCLMGYAILITAIITSVPFTPLPGETPSHYQGSFHTSNHRPPVRTRCRTLHHQDDASKSPLYLVAILGGRFDTISSLVPFI